MRRTAASLFGLVALAGVAGWFMATPLFADAPWHSAAAEKAMEAMWQTISGITVSSPAQFLYGRGRVVGGSTHAVIDPASGVSTFTQVDTGPCDPSTGTCVQQIHMNTVQDCVMPDNSLPVGTCNTCFSSVDYCYYIRCEAHGGTPQKAWCLATTSTVSGSTSTSTSSTSTTSTSTSTSTVTTTTLAGCTGSGTMLFTGNLNDWATEQAADTKTGLPQQYVANASSITICRIDVCLGNATAGAANDNNVLLQVYDNTGADRANLDGTLVPGPGTELGSDSDLVDATTGITADFQGTGGACGTTNNGQVVVFTWSGTKPNPTGNYWIAVKKDAGTSIRVGSNTSSASYLGPGDSGETVRIFNLWDNSLSDGPPGVAKGDMYFKVYTQ